MIVSRFASPEHRGAAAADLASNAFALLSAGKLEAGGAVLHYARRVLESEEPELSYRTGLRYAGVDDPKAVEVSVNRVLALGPMRRHVSALQIVLTAPLHMLEQWAIKELGRLHKVAGARRRGASMGGASDAELALLLAEESAAKARLDEAQALADARHARALRGEAP